jgi:hypothetical protein
MPEVYRSRKSRGRKSGRKSPRKSKDRKSGRKSPRKSKDRKSGRKSPRQSRNRFRGVTYRASDDEVLFLEEGLRDLQTPAAPRTPVVAQSPISAVPTPNLLASPPSNIGGTNDFTMEVDEFAADLESQEMLHDFPGYLDEVDLMIQQSEKLEDTIDAKSKWTPEEDAIIEEFVNQAKVKGERVKWKIIQKQLPRNRTADAARHRHERLQILKARKSGQASSSYKPAPQ